MMELKDTALGMCDPDYKVRFRAEYHQVRIRAEKLENMIIKAEAGKLDFTPTCPIDILRGQLSAMQRYLHYLRVRALIEGVRVSDTESSKEDKALCDGNCQNCLWALWNSPNCMEEKKIVGCNHPERVQEDGT